MPITKVDIHGLSMVCFNWRALHFCLLSQNKKVINIYQHEYDNCILACVILIILWIVIIFV